MHSLWFLGIRWLSALLLTVFYPVFYLVFSPLTLWISYGLLRLFTPATLQGTTILAGDITLVFVPACTAASAYLLLALLILLTKGISWRQGIFLFLLGSGLILIANIIRIQVLFYLLFNVGKNYFDTLHLLIWKALSSVYVAGVWIYLTWKFNIRETPVVSDFQALLKLTKER
ncbi:MAG TPA: pacearchaeosortase [Candidatus Nanoarchaeia archaeon]|nr:pacearchaeosortase [Candidatus Nanoarchaeia archaeon]